MSVDVWLSPDWMRAVRRDQALYAIADRLDGMASRMEERMRSARARGMQLDPEEECDLRAVNAACAFFWEFHSGARGVAIEVAAANKQAGHEKHAMPRWITAVIDKVVRRFCEPLLANTKTKGKGAEDAEADQAVEGVEDRAVEGVARKSSGGGAR